MSIFRYCKIILTYEDIPSEMLVSQHLAISLIMLIDGKHFLFNKFSKSIVRSFLGGVRFSKTDFQVSSLTLQ